MKIGIDLDGVVFDSENTFRVYEEIFAIEELHKKIINREEPKYQTRYNWTSEEQSRFNDKYLLQGSRDCHLMAGFKAVYERLKKMGFELIVITARGMFFEEMIDDAKRILDENNIIFDKYYWNCHRKKDICKEERIDIMIDDDYHIIEDISNEKIKTIYFRHENLKKLNETDFIHEVNNWGDIYRYLAELKDKK